MNVAVTTAWSPLTSTVEFGSNDTPAGPVLVGDVLLVRNGQEMAAFRLSLAGD